MKRSLLRRLGLDWVDVALIVALLIALVLFLYSLPWGAVLR